MEYPKVSVIIPVYNAEPYLAKCMNSILNQSLRELEIICVNDGSTDHSLEILEHYADIDSRVTVISQENATAGAARNKGIKLAKGEYLSFLDADDFFELDMLQEAYDKAVDADADIVVYRSNRFDEKRQQFTETSWTVKRECLPKKDVFSHKDMNNIYDCFVSWAWDKLFNRRFVIENELVFQAQKSVNDLFFVYSALSKAERITFLDKCLAHKRHNNVNSITSNYQRIGNWHCYYQALTALKQKLEKWNIYDELRRDFVNYAAHYSVWNLKRFIGSQDFNDFYNTLTNGWLRELDILNHEEEFFYDKDDYIKIDRLMNMESTQFLHYLVLTGKDGSYLFPFEAVPKGSKIVLYGAGAVGQTYYRQIVFSGFCQIVEWVDAGYKSKGMDIKSPDEIGKKEFDYIVVAINDPYVADKIMGILIEKNIERERIIWREPEIDISEI